MSTEKHVPPYCHQPMVSTGPFAWLAAGKPLVHHFLYAFFLDRCLFMCWSQSIMGDRVAWGVFKGLFAFFILLPIGGCIALVILGGGLASFENARENAQRDTSLSTNVVKATSTMDTPKFKRPLALQREQVRQQAALMQEEALRIEQQKRVEQLFEYRRQSALKGSPSASFDLGLMFLHGEGTETNVGLGLRWIKTAANNGYGSAIEFLKTHQP